MKNYSVPTKLVLVFRIAKYSTISPFGFSWNTLTYFGIPGSLTRLLWLESKINHITWLNCSNFESNWKWWVGPIRRRVIQIKSEKVGSAKIPMVMMSLMSAGWLLAKFIWDAATMLADNMTSENVPMYSLGSCLCRIPCSGTVETGGSLGVSYIVEL